MDGVSMKDMRNANLTARNDLHFSLNHESKHNWQRVPDKSGRSAAIHNYSTIYKVHLFWLVELIPDPPGLENQRVRRMQNGRFFPFSVADHPVKSADRCLLT